MVHALIISLIQSANRASAGILIQNLYFGCNTGDEDHVQKVQHSKFQGFRFLIIGHWFLAAAEGCPKR